MRGRLARALSAVVVVVAGAGCSGGSGGDAADTRPVEESTSTTRVDVSRIPETIDEAYVNAVLAALDEVDAHATRLTLKNRRLVDSALEYLRATFAENEFKEQVQVWMRSIQDGFPNIRPDPGARTTRVRRLVSATPRCIFAEVLQDFTNTAVEAPPPNDAVVHLVPLDPARDPNNLNPTVWMIATEHRAEAGSEEDLCAES